METTRAEFNNRINAIIKTFNANNVNTDNLTIRPLLLNNQPIFGVSDIAYSDEAALEFINKAAREFCPENVLGLLKNHNRGFESKGRVLGMEAQKAAREEFEEKVKEHFTGLFNGPVSLTNYLKDACRKFLHYDEEEIKKLLTENDHIIDNLALVKDSSSNNRESYADAVMNKLALKGNNPVIYYTKNKNLAQYMWEVLKTEGYGSVDYFHDTDRVSHHYSIDNRIRQLLNANMYIKSNPFLADYLVDDTYTTKRDYDLLSSVAKLSQLDVDTYTVLNDMTKILTQYDSPIEQEEIIQLYLQKTNETYSYDKAIEEFCYTKDISRCLLNEIDSAVRTGEPLKEDYDFGTIISYTPNTITYHPGVGGRYSERTATCSIEDYPNIADALCTKAMKSTSLEERLNYAYRKVQLEGRTNPRETKSHDDLEAAYSAIEGI